MSQPPQLHYAPRPADARPIWRWALLSAAAVVFLVSGTWFLPTAWRRVSVVRLQRQCTSYVAPARQIVFDSAAPATACVPRCWSELYALVSPPGLRSAGTVFLHQRSGPHGAPRLVAVDLMSGGFPQPSPLPAFFCRVLQPGTAFSWPSQLTGEASAPLPQLASAALKIYAGQSDPQDPAHFTIECTVGQAQLTLDGFLRSDDTVIIEPRKTRAHID